ncbi:hypothetical protein [Xanthomonas sacchari]|uniref:hypothetical protein n=1 Tax=Xanthomonas sacchari TaxID=56458 RepID=UPI00224DF382|nr:hypothetical protein [Xanthomonas sacchari]UYK73971.1 hypothetical protein NG828_06510 [Xanthomonas sacchari]
MKSIDNLVEKLYSETDFARSIATSLAGGVGLGLYLWQRDWAIAAFSAIIAFPILRLASGALHDRRKRAQANRFRTQDTSELYARLSDEEQKVVDAFAKVGGAVLTWSQVNDLELSAPAVESLMQREMLTTSMTADLMRETFVLNHALFEVGVARVRGAPPNNSFKPNPLRGSA